MLLLKKHLFFQFIQNMFLFVFIKHFCFHQHSKMLLYQYLLVIILNIFMKTSLVLLFIISSNIASLLCTFFSNAHDTPPKFGFCVYCIQYVNECVHKNHLLYIVYKAFLNVHIQIQ